MGFKGLKGAKFKCSSSKYEFKMNFIETKQIRNRWNSNFSMKRVNPDNFNGKT